MPSPKRPTLRDASARFLVTAFEVLLRGIATPSTRLREPRLAAAIPPARPTIPAPASIAGTFAPFAASLTAPPAVLAPSFAVSATVATGLLLDAFACGLLLRVVRFVALEPLRLVLDFARDGRALCAARLRAGLR